MDGSFKAIFEGKKGEISKLIAYVEEAYPELRDTIGHRLGFESLADDSETEIFFDGDGYINEFTSEVYEEMCKAAPDLSMEAYISWDCDGKPMNKYISAAGSAEVTEIEGTCCVECEEFVSFDDVVYDEDGDPVCPDCNEGNDDEVLDFLSSLFGGGDSRITDAMSLLENEEYQAGYDLMKECAEEDDATAAYNMGIFSLNGLPTGIPNYSEAEEWMEKASEFGDEDADDFLQKAKGIGKYYEGALNGDADDMGRFASALLQVKDLRTQGEFSDNLKIALEWAEKSAELDSGYGYYALGMVYEFGIGTKEDEEKALSNYNRSVEKFCDLALIRMAFLYMQGKMVEQDQDIAIDYMKKAADAGNRTAIVNMAKTCYSNDEYEDAVGYFSRVEDTLDGEEMYKLAQCYEMLEGIEGENTKQCYIKSMELGYPSALFLVQQNYPDVEISDEQGSSVFGGLFNMFNSDDDEDEYDDEDDDRDENDGDNSREKVITIYTPTELCEYIDPIDTDKKMDIKRNLRIDAIDEPLYAVISVENGNMMGVSALSGGAFSTDKKVIANVRPFIRDRNSDEGFGSFLVLSNQNGIPDINMTPQGKDLAINFLILSLQIQKWLEEKGILPADPENDPDDLRILIEIVDGEAVARVLQSDERIELTTQ